MTYCGAADDESLTIATASGKIGKVLLDEILNTGIPPRPLIMSRIDAEIHKASPDFGKLAEIIATDVALSAGILKVTNSPYYGFGRRIRSVPEAVMVLGLREITRTIAGIELREAFGHFLPLERFWDSAAKTARVSGWLAMTLGEEGRTTVRPNDAHTFGLFRDCGIAVLMKAVGNFADILGEANHSDSEVFTQIEDRHLSINHAVVGAELAEDWLLPDEFCEAIRLHHESDSIWYVQSSPGGVAMSEMIAITQMAEYLVSVITGLSRTREWSKLGGACLHRLGVTQNRLDELLVSSRNVIAQV